MAPLRASCLALGLLAGAAAPAASPPAAPQPLLDRDQLIHVDARSSDFDYKNNTLVFHAVRIAQGGFAIEAGEATATGLDFKASRWTFTGAVKITTPDGSLVSDDARITFTDNAIASAQITGAPASFEQHRDKRVVRGHAAHIDYDFAAGTVRLTENAVLSDGDNDIAAQTLIYDMRDQRVRANADDQRNQRVTFTINPRKADAKPEPKPKPEGKPEAKPNP